MNYPTKTSAVFLILPVMLLNLPFVGASICPMMPAMEKMSCCSSSNSGPVDSGFVQLKKAHCGCAISKSMNTDVNVINSPESSRAISKQLSQSLCSAFANNLEAETEHFACVTYRLHQQPKFLDSQKIYVFISSYLI